MSSATLDPGVAADASYVDEALYDDVLAFFRANVDWSGPAFETAGQQASALVLQEARALDARAYEDWLSLYGPRSVYWIPLYDQVGDPRTEPAIHFDDRRRMADRVALIRTGHLHAQTPPSRTCRVVSNVEYRESNEDVADVHSCLLIHEQRLGRRHTYAGRQIHRLARVGPDWRIQYRILLLIDRDISQGNTTFVLLHDCTTMASRTPRDVRLEGLAGLITQRRPAQTVAVAVDGQDAAGKTTLAGELADRLAGKGTSSEPVATAFTAPGWSGTTAGTCPRRALTATHSTTTPSAPSCSTRSGPAAAGSTAPPCSTTAATRRPGRPAAWRQSGRCCCSTECS